MPTASNEKKVVLHTEQSRQQSTAKVCVVTNGEELTGEKILDVYQSDPYWQELHQLSLPLSYCIGKPYFFNLDMAEKRGRNNKCIRL